MSTNPQRGTIRPHWQPSVYLRRFGKYIAYACIACVISVLGYWASDWLFAIRTIEVASSGVDVVIDERRLPRNLLLFPAEKIAKELLVQNPLLSDITFQKKFFHTLVVVPVVRTAVARLVAPERKVLVDRDGVVLGEDDGVLTLPIIAYPAVGLRVGGTVKDTGVQQAVRFLSGTEGLFTIVRITPYEERYLQAEGAYASAGDKQLRIFFTHNQDISAMMTTLQTLLTGFRIKGTLPALIDLRFDKPIVIF